MCDDKFLTKLPTREFIQGDTFILAFQFTDMDNAVIIPTKEQILWNLCSYEYYEDVVLSINGSTDTDKVEIDNNTGIVYIFLTSEDTENIMDGKYIQQPILVYENKQYIRAWGEVIFRRKVGGI